MAITPTVLAHGFQNIAGTSPATTASFTPTGTGYITVSVQSMSRSTVTSSPPTLTGLSGTWTNKVGNPYDSSGAAQARIDLYVCKNASGTGTLDINYLSNVPDDVEWCVTEWAGVDGSAGSGSDGLIQTKTATGSTANPSTSLSALASSNNAALGLVGTESNTGTNALTPGSGYTQLAQDGFNGGASDWLSTEWQLNATTVNWSTAATNSWGIIAAELAAATATANNQPELLLMGVGT